jgi:hypothetical protein
MPGGAVLGVVDVPAAEQRGAPFRQAALAGEVGEQAQGHRAQALAREVVAQAGGLGHELHAARDIAGQKLAQVHAAPALGVVAQIDPGLALQRRQGLHLFRRYRR